MRNLLIVTITSAVLVALAPGIARAQLQKETIPGINNFTRVDATVACAGALKPDAVGELKSRGYVSIINFRQASEPGAEVEAAKAAAERSGLRYIHLPFNTAQPDPGVVESFLKAVADRSNQPVFIHCGSANRVGAMWLVKRVLQDKWDVAKATEEAEAIGLRSAELKAFALDYVAKHQ